MMPVPGILAVKRNVCEIAIPPVLLTKKFYRIIFLQDDFSIEFKGAIAILILWEIQLRFFNSNILCQYSFVRGRFQIAVKRI
jgi:hypothetical protein